MQYIRKSIPGPGTKSDPFVDEFEGCLCDGSVDCKDICSSSVCACLHTFGPSYDREQKLVNVNPYGNTMKPIRECNRYCTCSRNCWNRVVQFGIQKKLQVFNAKNKGLGLKTLEPISKNEFVCEYIGEILTEPVARTRFCVQKESDANYILFLREHFGNGSINTTIVDPTYIGNAGRFINHSCQPNLYMVPVLVDCSVPKLCLFALSDIECGEELTFDYSGELIPENELGTKNNSTERLNVNSRKTCLCGAAKCRGYLPLDEKLLTGKIS